jgi:hypothetical protein
MCAAKRWVQGFKGVERRQVGILCNESQKDRGFRWILFEGFCAVNKTRKNRVFFCQEKWDRVSKDWTDIADVTTKIKLWLLAAFCKLTWNLNRRF